MTEFPSTHPDQIGALRPQLAQWEQVKPTPEVLVARLGSRAATLANAPVTEGRRDEAQKLLEVVDGAQELLVPLLAESE